MPAVGVRTVGAEEVEVGFVVQLEDVILVYIVIQRRRPNLVAEQR